MPAIDVQRHGDILRHRTRKTLLLSKLLQTLWWRRRESNPRPKSMTTKKLHAQSRSGDFALRAQNGQGARNASLWISFSPPRRSVENQPSVRRPFAAQGQSREERQLN